MPANSVCLTPNSLIASEEAAPTEDPIAINMVRKLPLVLALHERGVGERAIVSKTGLKTLTVRAWIKKYGECASQVVENLRETSISSTLSTRARRWRNRLPPARPLRRPRS